MGVVYESLVDVGATETDASSLGDRAVAWLVDRGIVAGELTGCVLGDETLGRRPGPSRALTTDEDGPLAPYNHDLRTCGLEVVVARSVAMGWPAPAVCPHCGLTDPIRGDDGELTEFWRRIVHGLSEWHAGGLGAVACPSCARPIGLNDWQSDFAATWAVGHMVLTFWNWPVLAKSFVADLAEAMGGRRLRHTAFKL